MKLFDELKNILSPDSVSASRVDIITYSRDNLPLTIFHQRQKKTPYLPDAIVWPNNYDDVVKILKFANEKKVPIVPYGAGSGVCGGTVALKGGIIIDLKRLDKIIAIDDKSLLVTAQAGINGQVLEDKLNAKGYTLGHFPASIYCSTLGGWLSTKAAGQLSTRYGKIEDMVVAVTAVLPTGEVISTKAAPRTSTGPTLMHLFVGSEGTLGIILDAVLRIWPLPEQRKTNSFLFKDISSGLEAIRLIMRKGLRPAVVRLYDEKDTALAMGSLGLKTEKGVLLVIGFEGDKSIVGSESKEGFKICLKHDAKDLGKDAGEFWWKHRYDISYKQAEILSEETAILDTIEVAATWDKLNNLYDSVKGALDNYGYAMAHFSHVYPEGGCIYFTILGEAPSEDESEGFYKKMWDDVMQAVINAGGTISHHHGIGFFKGEWLKKELGSGFDLLKRIKTALDPNNIMNPGKLGL
ncbi:MAG: FAD-binding oxidoreductase [Nitrospirae bacterium]|nr:FAD-binding oxidoreductase [Nitrospirota bacterium]